MKKYIVFYIFIIVTQFVKAQSKDQYDNIINTKIKKVNILFDSIKFINNDILRLSLNSEATIEIESLLSPATAFTDSFRAIKKMGKIFSPDNKFCIITWNVPLIDGNNIFFGFIQLRPVKGSDCKLFKLNDISNLITDQLKYDEFSPEKWFGALYYEIIPKKINKSEVYVILGSLLNDLKTNKKIIESLYFNTNGQPIFGLPIFDYGIKPQNRIIFEYAISINMNLRYHENNKMIVFDHLSPSSSMHNGDFKFYGPDLSYDGLKFEKDRWIYCPNIKINK